MTKWIVTKRVDWKHDVRTERFIVHPEDSERGTCECWEEGDADRIAAALNTAPFPGTPADMADRLRLAGSVLAETFENLIDDKGDKGDIDISKMIQLQNALTFWHQVAKESTAGVPPASLNKQGEPS